MRKSFAIALWIALAIAVSFIPSYEYVPVNMLIKLGIWSVLFGISFPLVTVTVPEITGLVTLNWFTGALDSFDQGLHFRYPWDIVREKNFFSLELVNKEFNETFAAKDGPMMLVKASFQYKPSAKRLNKFMAVDETVIEKGFADVLSGLLSEIIGTNEKGSEAVRREIDDTAKEVERRFGTATIKVENAGEVISPKRRQEDISGMMSPREKLQNQYGIDFQRFIISDIDFSPDYQEMRSAKARAERFAELTTNLKDKLEISGKDAANIALVEQKKAEKKIFEVEGLEGPVGNVASTIAKLFTPKKGKGGK